MAGRITKTPGVCGGAACVAGCNSAHPLCPSGQTCDTTANRCIECLTNSDCGASKPVCDTSNRTTTTSWNLRARRSSGSCGSTREEI